MSITPNKRYCNIILCYARNAPQLATWVNAGPKLSKHSNSCILKKYAYSCTRDCAVIVRGGAQKRKKKLNVTKACARTGGRIAKPDFCV